MELTSACPCDFGVLLVEEAGQKAEVPAHLQIISGALK